MSENWGPCGLRVIVRDWFPEMEFLGQGGTLYVRSGIMQPTDTPSSHPCYNSVEFPSSRMEPDRSCLAKVAAHRSSLPRCRSLSWRRCLRQLPGNSPVSALHLTNVEPAAERLIRCPHLSRVRSLNLTGMLAPSALRSLLGSANKCHRPDCHSLCPRASCVVLWLTRIYECHEWLDFQL
jgi:hypothetical protein